MKEEKSRNICDNAQQEVKQAISSMASEYMKFLNDTKTDRERVNWAVQYMGFPEVTLGSDATLAAGSTFCYRNKSKSVLFGIVGEEKPFTVVGTHIDFPHIDLKPVFLKEYAEQGCCALLTHYFGGIKKYQYQTLPLQMKITQVKNGKIVIHTIGDQPDDPVFTMPDLLVHLSQQQDDRKLRQVVNASEQQVLACGSKGEYKKFSQHFLHLLEQRTGVTEQDLPYCEFQMYPAQLARFVGLDKTIIGAPGQDDGSCTYAALVALKNIVSPPKYTSVVVLHSYEETGSNGTAGAQSQFLVQALKDILYKQGVVEAKHSLYLSTSIAVAADVTSWYDFNYQDVHEKLNAAVLNCGTAISRYTGSAGKSGSTEAPVELLDIIRQSCDSQFYQFSLLGKVDLGGGGTTAKFLAAQLNCEVVDIGVPVGNMHSYFELIGTGDLYATYQVYKDLMQRQVQ